MLERWASYRSTQRETVPEPQQGKREASTTKLQKLNPETTRRLRAINRAPEIVGKRFGVSQQYVSKVTTESSHWEELVVVPDCMKSICDMLTNSFVSIHIPKLPAKVSGLIYFLRIPNEVLLVALKAKPTHASD
jgi:hypothetical protein